MIRISAWNHDLSDTHLRRAAQLGVDCIDFGSEYDFPGVREQGHPDLDGVLAIKRRLASFGLEINRVTLPEIPAAYMQGRDNRSVECSCAALRVFAEAKVPLASQRFARATIEGSVSRWSAAHRGGYLSRAESLSRPSGEESLGVPTPEERDKWWQRFCQVFQLLAPIAEEQGIRVTAHPSDPPSPGVPLDGPGLHRFFDAFPSRNVGCIYCCGTRAEAGGSALVLDEIAAFGRRRKIFLVHFRNVRGSFASAGAFEEVLLDDGDLRMHRVLAELRKVGFDGCLNPDHYPRLAGDGEEATHALAYSVGYIKALLAAAEE